MSQFLYINLSPSPPCTCHSETTTPFLPMEWGLKPQEVSHPDGQPEWIRWWMAQVDVDTQAQAPEE